MVYDFVNKCGHIIKPIIDTTIALEYAAADIEDPAPPIIKKSDGFSRATDSNMGPMPP